MTTTVQYNLLFKVLRKSVHLKKLITDDAWRRRVIEMKYLLSKMDEHLYAYAVFVATNIDRFETRPMQWRNGGSSFSIFKSWGDQEVICSVPGYLLEHDPIAIVDLETEMFFVVVGDNVYSNGTVIFKGEDAHAFHVLAVCLEDMKHREALFREEMKVNHIKQGIFQEYGNKSPK